LSLSPDSCVNRTEHLFQRYGTKSLLVAKFVPGLNTVAPPLAGMFKSSFPEPAIRPATLRGNLRIGKKKPAIRQGTKTGILPRVVFGDPPEYRPRPSSGDERIV